MNYNPQQLNNILQKDFFINPMGETVVKLPTRLILSKEESEKISKEIKSLHNRKLLGDELNILESLFIVLLTQSY